GHPRPCIGRAHAPRACRTALSTAGRRGAGHRPALSGAGQVRRCTRPGQCRGDEPPNAVPESRAGGNPFGSDTGGVGATTSRLLVPAGPWTFDQGSCGKDRLSLTLAVIAAYARHDRTYNRARATRDHRRAAGGGARGAEHPAGEADTAMMTWNALRGQPIRVLVVDDEAPICRAVSLALQQAAYDVVTARSGEAAYSMLKAEHFDILVLDLRIPDERGDVIFESAAGEQPHLRYASLFLTGDISDQA